MATYNEIQPKKLGSKKQLKMSKQQQTPQQHQQQPPSNQLTTIPVALQDFSVASFNMMDRYNFNEGQRESCRNQIKYLVEKAIKENKIWQNDWTKQKLPIFDPLVPLELEVDVRDSSINNHVNNNSRVPSVKNKMNSRVSKDTKKRDFAHEGNSTDYDSEQRKKMRGARFERELSTDINQSRVSDNEFGYEDRNKKLVGICQDLEKKYFRLTSAPDPSRVRPLEVLKKSLEYILAKFNNNLDVKYNYICDQLKSIRQDLTVQLIQNEFTVHVYETHAKIAIENNDLGEYNQCQSRLKTLYRNNDIELKNKLEFLSYRILYYILTENYSEVCKLKLYELYEEEVSFRKKSLKGPRMQVSRETIEKHMNFKSKAGNVFIDFSLRVFEYIYSSNYHEFFQVYEKVQKLDRLNIYRGTFHIFLKFLSLIIEKFRIKTLFIMSRAYRKLSLNFLQKELKYDSLHQVNQFLKEKKLNQYLTLSMNNGEKEDNWFFELHLAKDRIVSLHSSTYKKVDIKGQI